VPRGARCAGCATRPRSSSSTAAPRRHARSGRSDRVAIDDRFRLIDDRPLPDGWIGKVWALERGRAVASGANGCLASMPTPSPAGSRRRRGRGSPRVTVDIVSFAPRFGGMTPASSGCSQRFSRRSSTARAPRADARARRPVLANGQCFLARASVLAEGRGMRRACVVQRRRHACAHYAARHSRGLPGRLTTVRRAVLRVVRPDVARVGRSIDLRDSTYALTAGDRCALLCCRAGAADSAPAQQSPG
jgi:dolichol-phosphate mannosyltransferase